MDIIIIVIYNLIADRFWEDVRCVTLKLLIQPQTSEVDEEALLHYGILPLKQDALENIVASRRS